MAYTELDFGKHCGCTLPQVLFRDPDWFFWAMEQGLFEGYRLKDEARDLYRKARRIRIPGNPDAGLQVQTFVHPHEGGVWNLEVVPADQVHHHGAIRSDYFDLSIPRRIMPRDSFGNRRFIEGLKFYHFGDSGFRMTRKRCEEFYDNPHIFDC